MESPQKDQDTIGRFVAIPYNPYIEVKTLDEILKRSARGEIPFYIIMRQNKFDDSVRDGCKIYEVLENGSLRLKPDNFH